MCLDGFEFKFFYHGLQPECIQLLFPALGYIVINKVNQVPDKKVHEKIKDTAGNQQYFIAQKLMFTFVEQVIILEYLHEDQGSDNGENQGNQQEVEKLLFEFFLQEIHTQDHRPHDMAEHQSQNDINPQPAEYLEKLFPGVELVKGIGKKDADQCKTAPTNCLE